MAESEKSEKGTPPASGLVTYGTVENPIPVHLYFERLPLPLPGVDERLIKLFHEATEGRCYVALIAGLNSKALYDRHYGAQVWSNGRPVGVTVMAPGVPRKFRREIGKTWRGNSTTPPGFLHGRALEDKDELSAQILKILHNVRVELQRDLERAQSVVAELKEKIEEKPQKTPKKEFVEIDGVMRVKINGELQPLPIRELAHKVLFTDEVPELVAELTKAEHEETMTMPAFNEDNVTRALLVGGTEPTARSLAAWLLKDRNIEVTDFWPLERPPKVQTADVPRGVTLIIVLEDANSAQHSNAVAQAMRGHTDVKLLRTSRRKAVLASALDVGGFRSNRSPAFRPIKTLLVGGPEDRYRELKEDLMARKEIDLSWHWEWDRNVKALPKDCEFVVILTDMAGHGLIEQGAGAAKRNGVPFVRTTQKWSQMEAHLDRELMKVKRVPLVDDATGEAEVDDAALLDFVNEFNEEKSITAAPERVVEKEEFINKSQAEEMLGLKNHHWVTQLVRDGHLPETSKPGPGSKGLTLQYRLADLAALELKIRDILPPHAFRDTKHAEWKVAERVEPVEKVATETKAPTEMPSATNQYAAWERVKLLLKEAQGLLNTALIEEVAITAKGIKVKRLVMRVTEEEI